MRQAAVKTETPAVERRKPKSRKKKDPHPADDLAFMRRRKPTGTGIDYWVTEPNVAGVGAYTADCETGHELAREYLDYIGRHPTNGNGTLLTCIVRDMIDQGKAGRPWTGLHVGFLAAVNRHAMAAAAALHAAKSRTMAQTDRDLVALAPVLKLSPDHELITAYEQWDEAYTAHGAKLDVGEQDEKLWATIVTHADFIKTTKPTTYAGVATKAKFLKKAYDGSDLEDVRPFFDELIALQDRGGGEKALAAFTPNAADQKLLEIYPRWHAAFKEWEAAHDAADAIPGGRALKPLEARIKVADRTQGAIYKEIDRVKGYGQVGAIVKLTIERTDLRSDENVDERLSMDIALLARSIGIEPYDYVSTNPEAAVA